ncbi:MAG: RIP metalloprotease RseP [Gemmatimonadaceae bacterium]
MLAWLAPLFVFGLVVFVHELGHFLAAKLTGVYAPVFAFGWGPRLFGFKRGETDYRWSWFPVGGYVAMATKDSEAVAALEGNTSLEPSVAADGADERPGHQRGWNPIAYDDRALRPYGPRPVPRERWIESKSLPAKVFILSAGVMMNIVLAYGVSVGILAGYGRAFVAPVVDSLVADRPAMKAGLLRGDSIVAVSGAPVHRWDEVVQRVKASPGKELAFEVVRGGTAHTTIAITPELTDGVDDVTGESVRVARIGVAPRLTNAREKLGLGEAAVAGGVATWDMARNVVKFVGGFFSGKVSVKNVGGPIAIARVSFQAARSGWIDLLSLLALLSVNVAILNLLPIPMLDGGQILLRVAERIKGGEFSIRTQEVIMKFGLAAIVLLFALAMFNDISGLVKLFG